MLRPILSIQNTAQGPRFRWDPAAITALFAHTPLPLRVKISYNMTQFYLGLVIYSDQLYTDQSHLTSPIPMIPDI